MQEAIKAGMILIKEGTLLPETLRLESEACVPGWRFVKDSDGCGLDREIHESGWTFSCLAGETNASVFGMDAEKMLRRAIEQILATANLAEFNSLEIVRVALVPSKRFLGVSYLTASAQSRHLQKSPFPARTYGCQMKQRESAASL